VCCEQCDWAIVSKTNESDSLKNSVAAAAQQSGARIVLLRDAQLPSFTKVLSWPLYSAVLSGYDYIWLLDSDVSFDGFDFGSFTAALVAVGSPLIAQAVMWTPDWSNSGVLAVVFSSVTKYLHRKHAANTVCLLRRLQASSTRS
jgi:hypothetical protein